ncbi:MAG: hypothetical protein ASARMPREDX12_004198 [Alectoria sarmentosa]|nr:MAG: hypothetical protein ASARMPRED_000205 [Alectoria sarmentosa]CAD6590122.1 MAG: hypothetical protein ASARMPREDX12_004198 [Alectoria sarmentosa]
MSTAQVSSALAHSESKSARKKKAKAEAPTQTVASPTDPEPGAGQTAVDGATAGADGSYESPYIKELYKNIRNIKKKLNATQKVDSIIAENPGSSLDELLSARKINQDQKAQAQKKPSLQASLMQLEEQTAQYKQFDEDYQKRLTAEKSALEIAHTDELHKVKEAAVAEAAAECKKEAKDNLLVLSKFLRAAAAKRQGGDETSPENRAFEGALLLVYGGEVGAVVAMESLIAGSDEKVPTVDQTPSEFTYKQVQDLAFEYAPYAAEEAWAEEVAQSEPAPPAGEDSSAAIGTDPTVAHAGLTEIHDSAEPTVNGVSPHVDTPSVPDASSIDAGAANAAAGTNWEAKDPASADTGHDEWVEIPRDPTETETGNSATPAGMTSTQSWAEDVPTESTDSMPTPAYTQTPVDGGDGFHEVQHHRGGRGRGGGQGEHRGGNRGGRGFRGDRGEGGGRSRGGYRGDRGGGEGGGRGGGRGRGGFRGNRGRGDGAQ